MYGFSHVSVCLSIFEMRNRNFLFHGRTREPLAQPEPHQLIGRSPSHTVGRGFQVCAVAPLCGAYVVLEKCGGFLSASEQPSLHSWNSNSQTVPYLFNR